MKTIKPQSKNENQKLEGKTKEEEALQWDRVDAASMRNTTFEITWYMATKQQREKHVILSTFSILTIGTWFTVLILRQLYNLQC